MELITSQYVKLADAGQSYAIRNQSKDSNSILLIVKSTTQPTYNSTTNANAFKIKLDETISSNDLPGIIWGAPLNKSVSFAIQTWTA